MAFKAASTSLKSLGRGRGVRLGKTARGCCTYTPQESSGAGLEPGVPLAVCPSCSVLESEAPVPVAASQTLAVFEARLMVC